MQIWKDIEGYKGHYQISNYGNVRSLKKDAFLMKGGYLKGYKIISLWKNGTGKMFRVHRLVAAAFIPTRKTNHVSTISTATEPITMQIICVGLRLKKIRITQ